MFVGYCIGIGGSMCPWRSRDKESTHDKVDQRKTVSYFVASRNSIVVHKFVNAAVVRLVNGGHLLVPVTHLVSTVLLAVHCPLIMYRCYHWSCGSWLQMPQEACNSLHPSVPLPMAPPSQQKNCLLLTIVFCSSISLCELH